MTDQPTSIDTRTCTACGLTRQLSDFHIKKSVPSGRHARCKVCTALYSQDNYENNKTSKLAKNAVYRKNNWKKIKAWEYSHRDPLKHKARQAVNYSVKTGKFKRVPCECGNPKVEFHHTNGYDEPNWFTGVWLCSKHRAATHKIQRTKALKEQTV